MLITNHGLESHVVGEGVYERRLSHSCLPQNQDSLSIERLEVATDVLDDPLAGIAFKALTMRGVRTPEQSLIHTDGATIAIQIAIKAILDLE